MECNILPPVAAMGDVTIYSLFSINMLTMVLTIVINYCFIVGMLTNPSLLTPTNLFIISLSVSDFLVGLIVQPLACALLMLDVFGSSSCLLENLVFITLSIFCGASGLCVPVISLDRYIRMKKLQYYINYVSKKRACLAIAFIWANALALAFAPFYGIPQDILFIVLIIYLVGCGVIMTISYKSVVRRSVAFHAKPEKPIRNCEIVYTKKAPLKDGPKQRDKSLTAESTESSLKSPQKTYQLLMKTPQPSPQIDDADISQITIKPADSKSGSSHSPAKQSDTRASCCKSRCILCQCVTSDNEDRENDEHFASSTSADSTNPPEKRRRHASIENSRQMRITVTVCLLVAVVIVSWMPTFIFSLIWALDKRAMNSNEMIITLHYIALTFGFACSCVNPLLYCSRIREVRKAAIDVFWKTFKCRCCCACRH